MQVLSSRVLPVHKQDCHRRARQSGVCLGTYSIQPHYQGRKRLVWHPAVRNQHKIDQPSLQVFLGTLRESEIERINERISQAVMETCLAMTIFRDQFNMEFVAMFVILTFVKVLHWLVQDRVDYLETTPTVSRLHHLRIITFMNVLLVS